MRTFATFGALSALTSAYAWIGPVSNVYIGNKNIAPDGFTRAAVLAGPSSSNLAFPGPLIVSLKGQQFRLNVIDQLTDTTMLRTTSIHWHGFFQKATNWADGPVGVSQCPITPGHAFQYRFNNPSQAGTFWYHSHHSTQYCDGLRGAMVVYDIFDPHRLRYHFDDESTVITLADWYHTVAPAAGGFPPAQATLINGKGRYAGGPTVPLSVIRVLPNKKYRFRLVSISCDPNFTFSIDGHTMTIIEADAVNTQPYTVDSIQIFAGQRYSVVVETNQPIGNYWIRANPNKGTRGHDGGLNSAIFRYWGAPVADPTTTSTVSNPMVEANLVPLSNPAAPGVPGQGNADVNLHMNIAFAGGQFTVNGAHFVPPNSLPVLLQIMSGASTPADLLPAGSVYVLPANKVVEISFTGGGAGQPHPIHLHGHTFDVVRSAGSSTYNYVNPIKRDVVSIGGASDNVTIRFATDNAGPWIMHCHIDWHFEAGLSVVFAEDVPTVANMNPPTSWDNLCPDYINFGPEFPTP
ncbi:yellow laccase [Panaeolus papilionaceus]|nr:yellow laccase [Panaeolus papilionaceus]